MTLELRGLSVSYGGGSDVVRDVDLVLETGTFMALIGRNGSGRTSLLRAIAGSIGHRGTIMVNGHRVGGRDASPYRARRHGISLVPERHASIAELTVAENVRMAKGWAPRRSGDEADVLDIFPELRGRWNVRAGLLSGGEQRKLGIALALVSDPRVLLVDEPSLGLDPLTVAAVHEALGLLAADDRIALISDEKLSPGLARLCTRVAGLRDGRIVGPWAPDEPRLAEHLQEVVYA
ncbi:ATP-binding cassette domain-containing protein [Phytohabitans kaempferiae]|uniref:ATP-binding cassette domain-containing protein n=1 Tax=Phytohabitans kaempferiae TaxID=1620943 RepID=A0ABV6M4Z7_9ACTN